MMKIGYLMQTAAAEIRSQPSSGPAIHVRHVFQELQRLGHDLVLLAKLDGQLWRSENLQEYEPVSTIWLDKGPIRLGERLIRRTQHELQLPYFGLFDSIRFASACQQHLADCDLFYERMSWMGYGASLAARYLNIPLMLEVNGDYLSEAEMLGIAPQGLQRRLEIFLMQKAINRAAKVVAAGDGWRSRFIDRWHLPDERVISIENGSDLVEFLDRDQLSAFTTPISPETPLQLVYLGGFYPWQGVTVLIKAVRQAMAQGVSLHLKFIGSGEGMAEAQALVENLGIGQSVTFKGQLPMKDFAVDLAEADIGLSPYCGRIEYSGLKLIDYKAAGLAILASGANGQPTILRHGFDGWIVPPCDVDALSQALVHFNANRDLVRCLGRNARIAAEQHHSWQHTTHQLNQLMTQVTQNDNRKSQVTSTKGISPPKQP